MNALNYIFGIDRMAQRPGPNGAQPDNPDSSMHDASDSSSNYSQDVEMQNPGQTQHHPPRLQPFVNHEAQRWGTQKTDKIMLADAPPRPDYDLGEWRGVKKVGAGGFGTAMLFARSDQNYVLQDRMVVKEQCFTKGPWYDPTQWIGAAPKEEHRDYDAVLDRGTHMEYHVHRRLDDVAMGLFPSLRGSSPVDHEHWRFRVYNEWCPLGTLSDVIRHYQDKRFWPNSFGFPPRDRKDGPDSGIRIPEPFIWMVWLRLTEAAQVMERGSPDADVSDHWTPIIHRDIKPSNVFLKEPSKEGDFQLYPRPVLADFGLCIESAEGDPNNPRAYQGPGTRGYKAPEQEIWQNVGTRDANTTLKLSSATNVFGNAMVIYSLVYRETRPELPVWSNDYSLVKALPLPPPGYSAELIELLHHCLRMRPAARPSLVEVRARIEPPPGSDRFDGMKEAEPGAWPWRFSRHPSRLAVGFSQDQYEPGFCGDEILDTSM